MYGKQRLRIAAILQIAFAAARVIAQDPAAPGPVSADEPARTNAGQILNLTIEEAVLMALQNNRALAVERLTPRIRSTTEDEERAAFDPALKAQLTRSQAETGRRATPPATGLQRVEDDAAEAELSVSRRFAAGTEAEASAASSQAESTPPGGQTASSRAALRLTQPILRGAGPAVNLARVRQAKLDVAISEFELRGFAEALVAQVEHAFWDLILAERQARIYEDSVKVAERQLSEILERIRVGRLPETERAAAEAELALRRENLINAVGAESVSRLRLLRLVNAGSGLSERRPMLRTEPVLPPEEALDEEQHVRHAFAARADLNEARLRIQRGDIEVTRTRNGLLPKLDLFVSLGLTGYAESFAESWNQLSSDTCQGAAGLVLEYPIGARQVDAVHKRATLTREQAALALENAAQLAELDVRSACIEVLRAREQVSATAATRRSQEEKARVELEKLRVGKSTSLLVAQVQRDLVASRINEVRALITNLKARIDLWRLDGSLLTRRGIAAPGATDASQTPPRRTLPGARP